MAEQPILAAAEVHAGELLDPAQAVVEARAVQPQRGRRGLHVARVIEVGLERVHELLVPAAEQVAQARRDVVERGLRERGQQAGGAQLAPAGDAGVVSGGDAQRGQRAPVRARRLAELGDLVALADERTVEQVRQRAGAQRAGRADQAHRAAVDLARQRVLGRRAGADAVEQLVARRVGDAHDQRAQRQVVVALQRRGRLRVAGQQADDELLLAAVAIEPGVGVGLEHDRGVRRGRARELDVLVADRRVLEQPQEPEPPARAHDRDAHARGHRDVGVRGEAHGVRRRADPVGEQRRARRLRRVAAEDARGADEVQLAGLRAVGERAQLEVVHQHRTPEPHAQRVDDLLQAIRTQTTNPCRIVSSVTTRGSTKFSR
jgi:hypothetical protein